jgi:penicillin-binding protein 2
VARTVRIKDHWAEQRLFLHRVIATGVIIGLLTTVVVGRLAQLQVVEYEYFSAQSQGNRIRIQPVPPTRGLILDRDGKVLAENLPSFALELTPEQVPDLEVALQHLVVAGLLDVEQLAEARAEIARHRRFDAIPIREQLTEEELARFAVRRPYFQGIEIKARLSRRYPYGEAIAHALGYVGGINAEDQKTLDAVQYAGTSHIGKVSVERAYEAALHGIVGQEHVVVNARGRSLQTLERQGAQPGQDVILSLQLDAQLAAYEALAGRRGAVVAIDPTNGEVLAFVSRPAFDPNTISAGLSRKAYLALQEDIDRPLFNRALRGVYPPGSTIKPMIALAALHHGVVTPGQRIWCRGAFSLPGSSHRYRDWKPEGHGPVDLHNGIAQSCDVYFYNAARDLGIDRMQLFLKAFGLGALTGLDVPGEKPGLVPSPEWKRRAFSKRANQVWFPGETVIAGIGQGYLLVTPVQLAHAVATIAARGERFQPHMIHGVRDPLTGKVTLVPPEPLPRVPVSDAQQWAAITEGMHAVLHGPRGTARAVAQGAPFQMAGKSGTAQVFTVAQTEKYKASEVAERLRDHALFVAFAPLEQPRIAVAVVVENGESGSKTAAPIARQVMEAYLGQSS